MKTEVARALRGDDALLRSHPFDVDDPFWRAAHAHGVHLLIAGLAQSSGASGAWPAEACARAHRAAIDASATHALRERELRRVLDRAAAAQVPCLLLKGAALAYTLYAQPHLRLRRDTDLLLRPEDVPRLEAVLLDAGYARAVETSGDLATSQRHFDGPGVNGSLHALDVHWRVANPQAFAHSLGFDELAASRRPVPALGAHAWTLSPAHGLLLACIHRAAHHPDSDRLLWIHDVHALATSLAADEAAVLVEVASRARVRAVCAHALGLAWSVYGDPATQALIARVRPEPGAEPEASARFLEGGLRQVDILRADVTELGWRRGAALLREHLFPPAEYMRSVYPDWPSALLPAAYVHRIVMGAPKWFRRPADHD